MRLLFEWLAMTTRNRHRMGIPPIRCSARSKRSQQRCKRWARPGAVVCTMHGGNIGAVARKADYQLSIAELAALDGRPLRAILTDAARLADVAMLSYEQSVLHGETDADTISRLMESVKYAAGVTKLALDSGLPLDPPPDAGMTSADVAYQAVAVATMAMAGDLVAALLPLQSSADVRYRDSLLVWARDRMRAATSGEPLPDMPTAPIEPETVFGGRDQSSPQWRTGVVDAEIVTDPDDVDEDLPGDRALIQRWERATGKRYDPEAV